MSKFDTTKAIIFHRGDGTYDLLPAGTPGHICENIPDLATADLLRDLWNNSVDQLRPDK